MQTVLVVDDDRGICTAIRAALEQELAQSGVRVLCAHSGLDALSLAADLLPDVIVLQGSLSDLSGLKVASRLRRSINGLKVILLMRPDEVEEFREEIPTCSDEVVLRPTKVGHLVGRIQLQLGEPSAL